MNTKTPHHRPMLFSLHHTQNPPVVQKVAKEAWEEQEERKSNGSFLSPVHKCQPTTTVIPHHRHHHSHCTLKKEEKKRKQGGDKITPSSF